MTDSQPLLADYAANGSERAFQELVARYVDLVYSTALRLVEGDTHRAEDVAQTVFVDLARMAAKLSPNSALGGWLHRHTCFVARTVMRGERRRQARERQAMEMSALDNQPDIALAEIAPVLDEAINELGADDRDAILLRFFERRNLRSVGEALGINENVAQKRVARAVQELATLLRRRGFTLPAAALATGLAAGAVTAAPAGLASSIAGTVFAGAGAAGGGSLTLGKAAVLAKLKVGIVSATRGRRCGDHNSPAISIPSRGRAMRAAWCSNSPINRSPQQSRARTRQPGDRQACSGMICRRRREAEAPPNCPAKRGGCPAAGKQSAAVPEKPVAESLALPIQRFAARSGSKVRIEGTANIIHPTGKWKVRSLAAFWKSDLAFRLNQARPWNRVRFRHKPRCSSPSAPLRALTRTAGLTATKWTRSCMRA